MKIKNAIIITNDDSELSLPLAELPDFSGNVVFSRAALPAHLATQIDNAVNRSTNLKTATADTRGASVNPELVG
jgi:hypothetical protein